MEHCPEHIAVLEKTGRNSGLLLHPELNDAPGNPEDSKQQK